MVRCTVASDCFLATIIIVYTGVGWNVSHDIALIVSSDITIFPTTGSAYVYHYRILNGLLYLNTWQPLCLQLFAGLSYP